MMEAMFKDPLRGVKWFDIDQFPYQKGEDEIELDFMVKGAAYISLLAVGGVLFLEGGFLVYLGWVGVSYLRRNN
jgi:hypothetical protein